MSDIVHIVDCYTCEETELMSAEAVTAWALEHPGHRVKSAPIDLDQFDGRTGRP